MVQHLKKRPPTYRQEFPASFANIIKLDGTRDKSTPLVTAVDLGVEVEEAEAEVEVEEESVVVAMVGTVEVAMTMVSANLKIVLILLTSLVSFMVMNGKSCLTRQETRFMHAQRGQRQSRSERTRGGR